MRLSGFRTFYLLCESACNPLRVCQSPVMENEIKSALKLNRNLLQQLLVCAGCRIDSPANPYYSPKAVQLWEDLYNAKPSVQQAAGSYQHLLERVQAFPADCTFRLNIEPAVARLVRIGICAH